MELFLVNNQLLRFHMIFEGVRQDFFDGICGFIAKYALEQFIEKLSLVSILNAWIKHERKHHANGPVWSTLVIQTLFPNKLGYFQNSRQIQAALKITIFYFRLGQLRQKEYDLVGYCVGVGETLVDAIA